MDTYFNAAYQKGLEKVEYMLGYLDGFPHITRNAKWLTNNNGHWTGGFWTGLLWLDSIHHNGGLNDIARQWAMKLRCRMDDCTTHDQGFIFGPSCVFGYRLTGDADFLPLIHAGGTNLIKQYVPETGLIQAWAENGYSGISIVDTIMNLPVLWLSGDLMDDPARKELSIHVAGNIQKYAVRQDHSTFHVVKWDEEFNISGDTHQGYSAETCWSRGQAWVLYGFANMYRYTGISSFLDTAIKLAEYYWDHLNADLLPAWDFCFQNDLTQPVDAAADSIAASGMALISQLLAKRRDEKNSQLWGTRADKIIQAEIQLCLYDDLDAYGIIKHATVDYPRKSGVDQSAMYGDYYFMEALYRRLNKGNDAATSMLY